jgi:hypothetical protein
MSDSLQNVALKKQNLSTVLGKQLHPMHKKYKKVAGRGMTDR